jgi:hypothetical protein
VNLLVRLQMIECLKHCLHQLILSAWIGASIGIMSLFTIVIVPMINLLRVLGSLGSLNTLIPSSWSLEVVGALNHLALCGRESLSSGLWPWLKLRLSRTEHMSS